MNDDQDDPLAQDEQPGPMGYPAGPTHHANRIANVPQPPRPALISQTQTAPQAPPAPPEPFTQADLIQMQRLQGALSTINKQVYSAEIEPEDGQDLKAQVHKQLGPLTQRQQATQQAAKQAAMQAQQEQLMHASAQARVIKTLDAQHAAEAFPQTVATLTDPVSGFTSQFLPRHNGDWEEVLHTQANAQEDRLHENPLPAQNLDSGEPSTPSAPQTPQDLPSPQEAAQQAAAQGQPLTLDQFAEKMKAAPPASPQIQQGASASFRPDSPGGQTQTVRGGVRLGEDPSEMSFNQFGEVERGAEAKTQNRSAEAALMDRARKAIGPPPRSTGNGEVDARNMAHWQSRVADLGHQMVGNHYRLQDHKDHVAALATAAAMATKERIAGQDHQALLRRQEAEAKIADKKAEERKVTEQQDREGIRHYRDKLTAAREKFEANPVNQDKELPEHLKPENEGKEAARKHMEDAANASSLRGGVAPNPNDPPTGGLDPNLAKEPNPIATPRRVMDIKPAIDHGLAAIPKEELKKNPALKPLQTTLKAMAKLIDTAHKDGRGLMRGEVEVYEQHHKELDAILQSQSIHDAPLVRATRLKPYPAEPAKPHATPRDMFSTPNPGNAY